MLILSQENDKTNNKKIMKIKNLNNTTIKKLIVVNITFYLKLICN